MTRDVIVEGDPPMEKHMLDVCLNAMARFCRKNEISLPVHANWRVNGGNVEFVSDDGGNPFGVAGPRS